MRSILIWVVTMSFGFSTCLRQKKISLFGLPTLAAVIGVMDVLAYGNYLENYGVEHSDDLPGDIILLITGIFFQNFVMFYDFRW